MLLHGNFTWYDDQACLEYARLSFEGHRLNFGIIDNCCQGEDVLIHEQPVSKITYFWAVERRHGIICQNFTCRFCRNCSSQWLCATRMAWMARKSFLNEIDLRFPISFASKWYQRFALSRARKRLWAWLDLSQRIIDWSKNKQRRNDSWRAHSRTKSCLRVSWTCEMGRPRTNYLPDC